MDEANFANIQFIFIFLAHKHETEFVKRRSKVVTMLPNLSTHIHSLLENMKEIKNKRSKVRLPGDL